MDQDITNRFGGSMDVRTEAQRDPKRTPRSMSAGKPGPPCGLRGNACGGRFRGKRQELSRGHAAFEMLMEHPSGDVSEWAVGGTSQWFKRHVQTPSFLWVLFKLG